MPIIDALEMQNASFQRDFSNQMELANQEARKPRPSTDSNATTMVLWVALALGGILAVRKCLPALGEALSRSHDPWAAKPATAPDPAAEAESFSQFVAAFTAGPGAVVPEAPSNAGAPSVCAGARTQEAALKPDNEPVENFLGRAMQELATIRTFFSVVSRAPNDAARQASLAG
ncbi:MAG TPA: hypothetical protein VN578_15745, partial [Candidatus Binatia bacterium]|nr:hypothetical protein [Candidatus Binatia bacterium]